MTGPRFSIITPVYGTPVAVLEECLDSVLAQDFDDWELCLVDDGSPPGTVQATLARYAAQDPRIKVLTRERNGGIVAASNDCLAMASGEFVVLFDHDDVMEPHSLDTIDACLRSDDTIDLVYSDADKLDAEGRRIAPFRKPDWSPERFRSQNYLIHVAVIRRSVVEHVGGFRTGFDGSQDYDLLLRASEVARRIHHVPEILYHWRIIEGSAAGDVLAKPEAYDAGRRAVQDHCDRLGLQAVVEPLPDLPGSYRVTRTPKRQPKVSVIIPTRGSRRTVWGLSTVVVIEALRGLLDQTDYPDLDVVVVVDPATPPDVLARLRRIHDDRLRLVWGFEEFDWSAISNLGAGLAAGELLLFLNDDVGVIHPDWLSRMVSLLEDDDVGAVGPALLFEDMRFQSAGHCHVGLPEHLGREWHVDEPGPFGLFQINREVSGVTGACLLTRASTFRDLGGMSGDFPNSYNDVDYCSKARAAGFRVVWTPSARLYHFEQSSRDPYIAPEHAARIRQRWGSDLRTDRYVPDGPWESPTSAAKRRQRPRRAIVSRLRGNRPAAPLTTAHSAEG